MVKRPFDSVPVAPALLPVLVVGIHLTPVRSETGQSPLSFGVALSELIAYSEDSHRTRINLTGRRSVNVQETVQQIDGLVRIAATQNNLNSAKVFLS